MYGKGRGVPQDYAQAVKCYREAAAQVGDSLYGKQFLSVQAMLTCEHRRHKESPAGIGQGFRVRYQQG